jgi:hypothetical protein
MKPTTRKVPLDVNALTACIDTLEAKYPHAVVTFVVDGNHYLVTAKDG